MGGFQRTQHSKYTVNTVLADAIHWCRLLPSREEAPVVRFGLVDRIEIHTVLRRVARSSAAVEDTGRNLLTQNTLLIQSLPIQHTAVDSWGLGNRRRRSISTVREVTTELDLSQKVLFYYRNPPNHD